LIVVAISVVVTNLITFLLVWVLPVIAFWLELVNITSAMRDGKAKIAEAQDANETNSLPKYR
jgi:fumarate reductase subunit D